MPSSAPLSQPSRPVVVVGCDHRRAGRSVRGGLVLSPPERTALARLLAERAGARGLVAIDTCARTEWLTEAPSPEVATQVLLEALAARLPPGLTAEAAAHAYGAEGADRHLLRVAAGLESFLPGEREVASQVHAAFHRAGAEGTSAPELRRLSAAAGRLVRRLERRGLRRPAGQGTPRLALSLLVARTGRPLEGQRIGVVGLGGIGLGVATLARAAGCAVDAFNRTPRPLAGLPARPLAELPAALGALDALVVATNAPASILSHDTIVLARDGRPLEVIDLGVPAQVAPRKEGSALPGLCGLDELIRFAGTAPAESLAAAEREVERALAELAAARERGTASLGRPGSLGACLTFPGRGSAPLPDHGEVQHRQGG